MKRKRLKIKKTTFFTLSTLLVLFFFTITFIFFQQKTSKNDSQIEIDSSIKRASLKKSDEVNLPAKSQYKSSEDIPVSDKLSVSIESVVQSNGFVHAKVKTSNSGVCVLSFIPNDRGKPVTKEVVVNNNICTADIHENEFSYIGQWGLSVVFYSEKYKAEASKNVTIY